MVGNDQTDRDTIVLHYDVQCSGEFSTSKKANGEFAYVNEYALSGSLTWSAQGNQLSLFSIGNITLSYLNII